MYYLRGPLTATDCIIVLRTNLVPRVLMITLFGQRLVARRDSGMMEKIQSFYVHHEVAADQTQLCHAEPGQPQLLRTSFTV